MAAPARISSQRVGAVFHAIPGRRRPGPPLGDPGPRRVPITHYNKGGGFSKGAAGFVRNPNSFWVSLPSGYAEIADPACYSFHVYGKDSRSIEYAVKLTTF
jgi:hypothetical protein